MKRRIREFLTERLEFRVPEGVELLTPIEVARYLRMSRDMIGNWRRTGKGPPFVRISRNTVRYPRRAFERWLRQHLQETGGK